MPEVSAAHEATYRAGAPLAAASSSRAPAMTLGMSLGVLLALGHVLCVVFGPWSPKYAMYRAWAPPPPGLRWISWPSFSLGRVETFVYGCYVAPVFGPLNNAFRRWLVRW